MSVFSQLVYVMVTLRNMGEVEAKWERVTRHDLRHDGHTVSLLTDHKTFKKSFINKLLGKV